MHIKQNERPKVLEGCETEPLVQSSFRMHAVFVAMIAMAIYTPTLRYGFTYLDDNNLILDQQELLAKPSALYKVFGHSFFNDPSDAYYRPVVNLTFAVNALLGGVCPFGYHLVNCLLHALACVLLLALLRGLGFNPWAALVAALIFAVHPANAASVAWIPGRNDALFGCCAFAGSLFLMYDARRPAWALKIGHGACMAFALFTIETAVCLPIIFGVLLWLEKGSGAFKRRQWMWVSWVIAFAAYALARHAVITPSGYVLGQMFSFWQRWPELLSGVGKLLIPLRLQVLAAPQDVLWWPGVVTGALLIAVCFLRGMRRGIITFAWAMILLPLMMSLLGARNVMLETRLYLPAAGICVLAAEFLRGARVKGVLIYRSAFALVIAFGLMCCIVNLHYVPNFRDRTSFSQAAIKGSPNSGIAHSLIFKASYKNELQTGN
jgi:hypothetical protein